MVKSHVGMSRPPGAASWDVAPPASEGRLLATVLDMAGTGGLLLLNLYAWVSEPFSTRNLDLLHAAVSVAKAMDYPWVLCGDFNVPAQEMQLSAFLRDAGAALRAPPADGPVTCTAGNGSIDYFIVCETFLPAVRNVSVCMDAPFAPHRPVMLLLDRRPRAHHVRKHLAPRRFPYELQSGPFLDAAPRYAGSEGPCCAIFGRGMVVMVGCS